MTKILTLIILSFLINTSALADTKKDDIVISVKGMVCDFCAQSLKKVFGKEKSVNGITINLDNQTVSVDIKENTDLTDDKIKELIEWGGYDLVKITRN